MQAIVHGLWKKGISQAQKVFEGFKRPRINIKLFINSFSIVVFVEEMTYNLINLKYQNSLNIGYMQIQLFSLMNNQSQSSDNFKGFIMDAKGHGFHIAFLIVF